MSIESSSSKNALLLLLLGILNGWMAWTLSMMNDSIKTMATGITDLKVENAGYSERISELERNQLSLSKIISELQKQVQRNSYTLNSKHH